MKISSHEAGHCVVATILGYQGWAYALPHRGRFVIYSGRASTTDWEMIDPVHRAAIGLGGALGELMIRHPRASREEAQRFVIDSGRVSTTDWEMIGNEMQSSFHGLWLAVEILRKYHPALVRTADHLVKFGEVNPIEAHAICQKLLSRHPRGIRSAAAITPRQQGAPLTATGTRPT